MRNIFVFSFMLFAVLLGEFLFVSFSNLFNHNLMLFYCITRNISMHCTFIEEYDSLSYTYFDEIAQAYCAAHRQSWAFAIRRKCKKCDCNKVCRKVKKGLVQESYYNFNQ